MRKEFEQFMFSEEGHKLYYQMNSHDITANKFAWEVWKECAKIYQDKIRDLQMDYEMEVALRVEKENDNKSND